MDSKCSSRILSLAPHTECKLPTHLFQLQFANVPCWFLWVRFTIDRFAEVHTKRQMRKLVERLLSRQDALEPDETYSEIYGETLGRIESQSKSDRELALKALLWVTTAARIITCDELRCALSVEPGDNEYDEENVCSMDLILAVSAGLLVLDSSGQHVTLVHFTAQEYLERRYQESRVENHLILAETCLTYLCFRLFDITESTSGENDPIHDPTSNWKVAWGSSQWYGSYSTGSVKSIPIAQIGVNLDSSATRLLDYAANFWGVHARYCEDAVSDLALKLLANQNQAAWAFRNATSLHQEWSYLSLQYTPTEGSSISTSGIHLVCALGLAGVCAKLCTWKGPWVDDPGPNWSFPYFNVAVKDGCGRTPLMWAAHHGHCETARQLLSEAKHGPPLNTPLYAQTCKRGETALHYAARQGHASIVLLLIEQLEPYCGYTHPAAWEPNHFQESALVLAALGGHRDVVSILMSCQYAPAAFLKSADQEIIFGIWPVHKAAQRCPADTFKLLVESCHANIDQQDPKGYSPFAMSVDWGNEAVVRYYVESEKAWLADNCDQVLLATHLAAANPRRFTILRILVETADYVLTTPSKTFGHKSLLATAVDAGNMQAAMYIAAQFESSGIGVEGVAVEDTALSAIAPPVSSGH